uniref:Uncharacterized protein n=1 Tax=Rhizophora mucronata TaxID=61149 RepID=A0A2P2PPZ7_RHIMU
MYARKGSFSLRTVRAFTNLPRTKLSINTRMTLS